MSYTSTYELYSTKVNGISEHKNGYGSGPAIWEYVSIKLTGKSFPMFDSESFWPSYKDDRLSEDERAVLLSTYDNAFVETDRLKDFASACHKVHDLIIAGCRFEWSHFKAIGDDALWLSNNADYRCKGLCIGCTSVCDPWEQYEIKNIDVWGVYAKIDEIRQSAGEG